VDKKHLERQFAWALQAAGVELWAHEYRFDKKRRFRFDFAWPTQKVAVEIQGGTWTGGGHVRGKGYTRDCEKMNLAQSAGWRVFQFTTDMLREDINGCVDMVKEALCTDSTC
jgi:very-short-patch-repair endonuclease